MLREWKDTDQRSRFDRPELRAETDNPTRFRQQMARPQTLEFQFLSQLGHAPGFKLDNGSQRRCKGLQCGANDGVRALDAFS